MARAKPLTLNRVNGRCPESGNVLRFVFVARFQKPLGGRPIGRTSDSESSISPSLFSIFQRLTLQSVAESSGVLVWLVKKSVKICTKTGQSADDTSRTKSTPKRMVRGTHPVQVEPNVIEPERRRGCHLEPLSGQTMGMATSIRKMAPSPNKGPSALAKAGASPASTHA
jgi:hypothetical protein